MSKRTWLLPWGEEITIEVGMPEHPVRVDGECSPFQSSHFRCDDRAALAGVLKWLGPQCYGDDDGDLQRAIDGARDVTEEE